MPVVGLTGGIASGKSAVADQLAALGVAVVDTDQLAREIVAPGQPALAEIVHRFGSEVLDADGGLDRSRMRARVFADASARADLEAITHPRIHALAQARLRASSGPYAVVVVPLLVEKGRYDFIDRVLVVDVDPGRQLQRLQQRDGVTAELARAMIAAQCSRERRLMAADDVIHNDGTWAQLTSAVRVQHQRYLDWASACS